ncbi:MAG: translation initiation factor IF-2 subunit alpha [Thermoplasmatales archaeon]|nr:translation initiation factor IF-2 subunit alpha [Thermoplasmatales archaeon]
MSRSKGYPEIGELVVCSVSNVRNFGAFVTLDEYDGKEGFVHVRDVATGWVKYIRDYIREGQKIVCKVLDTDHSKGHIDLSLKSVNEHQKREKIQQWKNENKAEKLVEIVAEACSMSVDEAWKAFAAELLEAYGTLYHAFESVAVDQEEFRSYYDDDWVDAFVTVAIENIVPPYVEISGVMTMRSYEPDGVEIIRKALMEGLGAAGEEGEVEITCVGCPKYRIHVKADNYKIAEEILKNVSTTAMDSVLASGGEASFAR